MNIGEIAQLAGVSRAAVSRYFNNGYISEEKREQIRKVVEKTGYQPSAQAQNLRMKKTKTIGVILPKINSDSVGRVVAGISSVLEERGYQLLLGNTYNSLKKEQEYLRFFDSKRVDGVVFIATIITKEHERILSKLDVPVILVGQHLEGYSCVYHDDYSAMKTLVSKVLEKGCTKVGYLGVTLEDEAAGVQRQNGFLDALKAYDAIAYTEQLAKDVIIIGDFTIESGYENTKLLLERVPTIEAIICATDRIAIGALRYLKECSHKTRVYLTGIGDSQMSKVTTPTLTTVHYYYKNSGMEAASILIDQIEHNTKITKAIKMGYQIVEQESTTIGVSF